MSMLGFLYTRNVELSFFICFVPLCAFNIGALSAFISHTYLNDTFRETSKAPLKGIQLLCKAYQ